MPLLPGAGRGAGVAAAARGGGAGGGGVPAEGREHLRRSEVTGSGEMRLRLAAVAAAVPGEGPAFVPGGGWT